MTQMAASWERAPEGRSRVHAERAAACALVRADGDVRAHRGTLVVAQPSEVCRRILARTGLDRHIDVSPTVRHALRRIAPR